MMMEEEYNKRMMMEEEYGKKRGAEDPNLLSKALFKRHAPRL